MNTASAGLWIRKQLLGFRRDELLEEDVTAGSVGSAMLHSGPGTRASLQDLTREPELQDYLMSSKPQEPQQTETGSQQLQLVSTR